MFLSLHFFHMFFCPCRICAHGRLILRPWVSHTAKSRTCSGAGSGHRGLQSSCRLGHPGHFWRNSLLRNEQPPGCDTRLGLYSFSLKEDPVTAPSTVMRIVRAQSTEVMIATAESSRPISAVQTTRLKVRGILETGPRSHRS